MTKINKTPIVFGYGLFALTIVTVLVATVIPLTRYLFNPQVKQPLSIFLLVITLFLAAVLPVFISYIFGDKATHVKNKTSHHLNGVLFGVAAYWVYLLLFSLTYSFGFLWASAQGMIAFRLIDATPIVLAIIVMAVVAGTYARHQKKKSSVLHHRPYQITLIASVALFLCTQLMNPVFDTGIFLALAISSIAIPIVLTAISFRLFRKQERSKSVRLSAAIVAMSFGMIVTSLSGQYIAYLSLPFYVTLLLAQVVGVVVWALYMWFTVRHNKA